MLEAEGVSVEKDAPKLVLTRDSAGYVLNAVSYTHLDVYKRQADSCRIRKNKKRFIVHRRRIYVEKSTHEV